MGNVIANFVLSEDVPSPKVNGIKSGYSAHHKFGNVDYLVSGRHQYNDNEIHYPGELIVATITFASWEYIKSDVKVGDTFEVREMNRLVGYGNIIEVL